MTNSHLKRLEFILRHDGKSWIASHAGVEFFGSSLEEVDKNISLYLSSTDKNEDSISVCMRFDMTSLPRWLHQYSSHYFNRTVKYTNKSDKI